jgi:outer membrane protein assembly factor BamB
MVKPPLGLLWFGGPSNAKILPRHGHGPSPQVAGGRLFIEGADIIRAVDVYTGRLLWERELKDVGKYYNITGHFAGAGEIGSNYVSMPDAVYVVYGTRILELDVNTGQTKKEFSLPDDPNFGWLSVQGDYLVTTIAPIAVKLTNKGKDAEVVDSRFASGSRQLAVFNRQTGKLLWTRDAKFNFRHNNIALGADSIYVIDSLTETRLKALNRRGIKPKGNPSLSALDLKAGRVLWQSEEDIFGTFLNYSSEHDLLLQAGSAYRDRAKDDIGKGMIAYQGRSGKVIWANRDLSYSGPCLLMKDRIITNGNGGFALDIKTGKPTGWKYTRNYGCNTAIGSEHLLTFRSGAAGFYDLKNDGGTGNWGGFRSSCTANLIPANGVLNAPDYTRTCSCAYQMQTSLGLIHMPELEYWTFGAEAKSNKMAINLGAPGDRRDPDGRMWLEYPEVGGPSTKVDVSIEPKDASVFRVHSTAVESGELKWIAASGLEGAKSVRIAIKENGNYQVKLHFMEPKNIGAGKRVFDVALQGETVLSKLDVVDAAGGYRKAIVKDFNVAVQDNVLKIELFPQGKQAAVLSGIQWHSKP